MLDDYIYESFKEHKDDKKSEKNHLLSIYNVPGILLILYMYLSYLILTVILMR